MAEAASPGVDNNSVTVAGEGIEVCVSWEVAETPQDADTTHVITLCAGTEGRAPRPYTLVVNGGAFTAVPSAEDDRGAEQVWTVGAFTRDPHTLADALATALAQRLVQPADAISPTEIPGCVLS